MPIEGHSTQQASPPTAALRPRTETKTGSAVTMGKHTLGATQCADAAAHTVEASRYFFTSGILRLHRAGCSAPSFGIPAYSER